MVWLTWAASYIFHALAWKLFFFFTSGSAHLLICDKPLVVSWVVACLCCKLHWLFFSSFYERVHVQFMECFFIWIVSWPKNYSDCTFLVSLNAGDVFFWVRLESHTIDAYSITLLTCFVYTLIRTVLLPPICLSLFNIYNILYALFVMFDMFCCHLRSLVMTTPRSFISLTTPNTTPSMFNSGLKSFLFDVLKSMT